MAKTRASFFRKVFSDTENQIIEIIKKRKRKGITISEITDEYYSKRSEKPFNANNWIAFVVRQIEGKCKYNSLPWTIGSEGTGRHGKTVWVEKRT